jgi:hypothetical protein
MGDHVAGFASMKRRAAEDNTMSALQILNKFWRAAGGASCTG